MTGHFSTSMFVPRLSHWMFSTPYGNSSPVFAELTVGEAGAAEPVEPVEPVAVVAVVGVVVTSPQPTVAAANARPAKAKKPEHSSAAGK